MIYKLTKDTRSDILGIRRYTVKTWGKEQSSSYIDDLTNTFSMIAKNPEIRLDRTFDIKPGVRSFVHGSHIVYYISTISPIVVIGVLHQNMDPQNYLAER